MGIGNPIHLMFIAAVALIVLGPKRLPELARTLGEGIRSFRESLGEGAIMSQSSSQQAEQPHTGAPVRNLEENNT